MLTGNRNFAAQPLFMFIESLYSALSNEPTITALLGLPASRPDSTTGVFPMQAVDGPTMPYVVLTQASGEPTEGELMDGTGPLTTERWRISCYGTTYLKAKQLAKTVRVFLLSLSAAESRSCVLEADDAESIGKGPLFGTHVDFDFVYQDS
jgi:hypothetical protein